MWIGYIHVGSRTLGKVTLAWSFPRVWPGVTERVTRPNKISPKGRDLEVIPWFGTPFKGSLSYRHDALSLSSLSHRLSWSFSADDEVMKARARFSPLQIRH